MPMPKQVNPTAVQRDRGSDRTLYRLHASITTVAEMKTRIQSIAGINQGMMKGVFVKPSVNDAAITTMLKSAITKQMPRSKGSLRPENANGFASLRIPPLPRLLLFRRR